MRCPHCQAGLIEIPTSELPQIDVCPSGHGLWMDRREMHFFVEQYEILEDRMKEAPPGAAPADAPACPRCRQLLCEVRLSETVLLDCRSCHGRWLPQGSLTKLNQAYRGKGAPIRIKEQDFYTRAAARQDGPKGRRSHALLEGNSGQQIRMLSLTVILGGGLLLVAFILIEGIRKEVAAGRLVHELDGWFFWLVLGILAGLGLFLYGFVLRRQKHLIESIPTCPIRSLAVGLVEVAGTVEPNDLPLYAPFSRTPCVLYSYKVEERRKSGKSHRWVTIRRGASDDPFFVRDRTGEIFVEPTGADLLVEDDRTYDNVGMKSLPPEVKEGLTRLGVGTDGWVFEKTLRCTEAFISPKDLVYVLGTAQPDHHALDAQANEERLFIGSHPDELFIISDRSEKDLLAEMRWQVGLMLWGGPLLTLVCLFVILSRYVRLTP